MADRRMKCKSPTRVWRINGGKRVGQIAKGWKGVVEIVEKFRRNQSELLNSTRANECSTNGCYCTSCLQAVELVLE